ncbi:MAG: 4-hydroxy-tetrahydrodipicolinate reductase [Ilumatobacter sp.]|nr:4-hydroxy-tetrahydrodipicolinate reductase [Ilumatobacter sp.]
MRVGVNGASGRMGTAVCAAVAADAELELAAAVDVQAAGEERSGVTIAHELRAFADARCDVVVDFTVADAVRVTLPWLAMHEIHAVVGTTGLGDDDLATVRSAFGEGPAHCLLAPNFAISAVLMARFAEIAAPHFDTCEVIEYHHAAKVDAPSGTAVNTAERIASARGDRPWRADPTEHEVYAGARGGSGPSGVRVHSVRMHGMIAHQDVIFGADGQSLTIRQDSYDRSSFMPGVVLACKRIGDHPGVVVGLDRYLGL